MSPKKLLALNLMQLPFSLLGVIFIGLSCYEGWKVYSTATPDPLSVQAAPVSSVLEVESYVLGPWTFVSATQNPWHRMVFKADGTVEIYMAMPADNDWGTAEIHRWHGITNKYSNTGTRYFGISIDGFMGDIDVTPDGNLHWAVAPLTKGERFPFSK